MSHKVKKYIWYQFEEREANYVEQPEQYIQLCLEIKKEEKLQVAASTLILRAKKGKKGGREYTTLNSDFFFNECSNNFDSLISKFDIKRSNPIKVTLPGMSFFPLCLLLIFPVMRE